MILWLASRSGDTAFVNREASKLVKLVEASVGARPIPIVSFVARQRDLRTLMGEHALGAEVRTFEDALAYFEARFSRITLEDRNLAAISRHRILRPKNETARLQIKQAFEKVKRGPEAVRDILLTSESTIEDFEELYPFSPALVKTLVVISSILQRERTALKIMMQLLVENQDTMRLGELVPVGALFGAMLDGNEPVTDGLRQQFDKARKLWEQKVRPALLRSAGLSDEQLLTLPSESPQARRFRADEQIIGTLVLSELAPEAETLRALTARRLAALNYGTIKVASGITEDLLKHMLVTQILFEDSEIVGFGPAGERLYGAKNFMALMSVFDTPSLFQVICGQEELGWVHPLSFAGFGQRPVVISLGGRAWEVIRLDEKRSKAHVRSTDAPGRSRWLGESRVLSHNFCQAVRDLLGS